MLKSFLLTFAVLLAVWVLWPTSDDHRRCPAGFDVTAECRHFNQALTLMEEGDQKEAEEELRIALCIDPQDSMARECLQDLESIPKKVLDKSEN